MTIAALLARLSQQGIRLRLEGEQLVSDAPAGAVTPDILAELRSRKPDIIAFLAQGAAAARPVPAITPAPRDAPLPLTFAQQRLWFLDQIEPVPGLYTVYLLVRLSGRLELEALRESLAAIVRRHGVLRTTFPSVDGTPYQAVAAVEDLARCWEWAVEALDAEEAGPGGLGRRVTAELRRPFNLETGPLLRARVYRLGPDAHALLVSMHHIIADGWSLGIFRRELSAHYAALRAGHAPALPDLALQYADIAVWQRLGLEDDTLDADLDYWRERLARLPPLELPTDWPRPAVQSFRGGHHRVRLAPDLVGALRALGRGEGCSLFMTLMAGFQALLHRSTGQEDLAVGTPVAGRTRPETEPLLGVFVNTLVLRADFSGAPTFRALLRQVRERTLEAQMHQKLPFERLVEALQPRRELSRNALFQVMFIFQYVADTELALPGLDVQSLWSATGTAKFDLSLALQERAGGGPVSVDGLWEYAADLFDADTIARMQGHFETLLQGLVAAPDVPLRTVPMVSPAERRRLLVDWNATATARPRWTCVHQLVEQQVDRAAERVAATGEDWQLTYGELESQANRMAHYLRKVGVGPETLVGVSLPRTPDLLIALMGIFKAGGAYLPLDPEFPKDRLAYMLADGQASLLVTCSALRADLPAFAGNVICVDRDRAAIARCADTRPAVAVTPAHLAYTIYTSGSTGRPKGVEVTHGNVVNCLQAMAARPGLGEDDVLVALTTLSFDISVLELFGPLSVGGQVALATRETANAGERLRAFLEAKGATVMQATPATWRLLLEAGWPGQPGLRVLVGGEALRADLASRLIPVIGELWNMYGPTETTIWSTCARITDADRPITIGTPIDNTQVYVLDAQRQIGPAGVPGELYIGGVGVTRGYRGQPGLTAERFVADPFSGVPGARLYRTGDLVRFRPDGSLEYLDRLDNQVKVHGFRIELEEIEAVLAGLPEVQDAAVAVRPTGDGDTRLVAYVVYHAGQQLTMSEIRRYLRDRLPAYMVPGLVMELSALPYTPNGKVDRKALPDPLATGAPASHYVPPVSLAERIVAETWEALLPETRAGRQDNFFELGGHSLLSMRAVAAIQKRTGTRLDPRLMFFQTLEQIAAALEPKLRAQAS